MCSGSDGGGFPRYKMLLLLAILSYISGTVAQVAPGSDGPPPPCKQDICLRNYNQDFHRLKIICADLRVNLGPNGDPLKRNVSLDRDSGCITWKSGSVKQCSVTEIHLNGMSINVSFTYNCTRAFATSTTPALIPNTTVPSAGSAEHKDEKQERHHTWAGAAAVSVLILVLCLIFWSCCLETFQKSEGLCSRLPLPQQHKK